MDARFLLANERTLLSWTRTALTLIASGVGLQQLVADVPARTPLALALVLAGMAAMLAGGLRYRRADHALRRRQLPPVGLAPYLLTISVVAIGSALLVAIAVSG